MPAQIKKTGNVIALKKFCKDFIWRKYLNLFLLNDPTQMSGQG